MRVRRALAPGLCALMLALAVGGAAQPSAAPSQPPSDPAGVVGPPRGAALSGAALEARTEHVAGLLRCPVCQGLSVADSPSDMAQSMKKQVRELLAAGYEQEQVLVYFESSYGEFVRLQPPLRGVNWIVWLAPLLGLAAGALIIRWALAKPSRGGATATAPAAAELPSPGTLPEDPKLAAYVRKVRELAYGWPGGTPPSEPKA